MDWSGVYGLDADTGVRMRKGLAVGFDYSDGAEAEAYILESVTTAADVSSGSDELVGRIRDWPSEYHFSASRSTLLAPFDVRGLTVLEVGCGCGAITRALAEAGAHVVALEGSPARARITAARCRGLHGVDVVCDDFRDFQPPAAFDVVFMIGVLEYAPSYFPGDDPAGAALAKASECLTAHGAVVVAIENQLGLAYLAGRGEDHTGRPFYGVEDRYGASPGVVTFGRRELSERLAGAGLARQTWHYPFPDYKLPRVILTEAALADPELDCGRLAAETLARDYGQPFPRCFSEEAAWEVAGRNGLVGELANSFLVVAGRAEGGALASPPAWLAEFRAMERVRAFRTKTRLIRAGRDLVVAKSVVEPGAPAPQDAPVVHHVTAQAAYLPGSPLAWRLRRLLDAPGTGVAELGAALSPWIEVLAGHSHASGGRAVLPGTLFDAVPWNLMTHRDPSGRELLTPFDLEWEYRAELALDHVVLRGLVFLLGRTAGEFARRHEGRLGELISQVSAAAGAPLSEDRMRQLMDLESQVQVSVTGLDPATARAHLVGILDAPLPAPQTVTALLEDLRGQMASQTSRIAGLEQSIAGSDDRIAELVRQVAELEEAVRREHDAYQGARAQIAALEQSTSWRVTAPLRRLRRSPGAEAARPQEEAPRSDEREPGGE
jgi:SAM-dependent methyltransferase